MASYNAGIVTAYGAAVRGGYTGTYEQFCSQQANYAQTAAAVEQAKTDAQAAAQRAQDVADSIPEDYTELTEEVGNLKDDLNALEAEEHPSYSVAWEVGGIGTTSGDNTDASNRRRTPNYYKESDFISIASGGAELYLIRYSYDGNQYTFYGAVAVYGVNDPYNFSEDSSYYFRLSCSTPALLSGVVLTARSRLIDDVKNLVEVVPQLQDDVAEVKSQLTVDEITDLFSITNLVNKSITWSDGSEVSNNDARTSDFLPVSEGDVIAYTLTNIGQVTASIGCYDSSKNYLQNKSVKAVGSSGSWVTTTGTYTIPSGVSFIKFSSSRTTLTTDSITKTTPVKIGDFVEDPNPLQWQGKKWAAFGTSITDTEYIDAQFLVQTGKYPPYLAELSGMKFTNYGIAGGSIMTDIQNKVKQTTLTGFDVVTVEGSVNDHATNKPIGDVGDTGTDTFAGAIYQIAKYVYENSNATLFFITDYVGRYVHINPTPAGTDFYGNCAPTKRNTLDLLQIDYINMMIKQCEYFGIPCITAGQDSGINLLTGDLYLIDHIHSTFAGGKQYAETIWSYLKNVRQRVLSV